MKKHNQTSIAINHKKNQNIINNSFKILNTALMERVRENTTEIAQLRDLNSKLLAKIERYKIQKTTP
jgi:hypothetical protein